MDRVKVKSSQVAAIGYDAGAQVLEVEFPTKKPGDPPAVYQYANVPRALVQAFFNAPSVGTFFARAVKGRFETFKMIDGKRVPLAVIKASPAQVDYAASLAKRAGLIDGALGERMNSGLQGIAGACGIPVAAVDDAGTLAPQIVAWLASLSSTEIGALITELKGRA